MGNSMSINTTEMKQICSDFNSKVSSVDLPSIDVAGAFEPFTSQGILTGYVSSLKDALASISENCTNISSILNNLADTQEEIDNSGKDGADSGLFTTSGGGGGGGSSSGGGGGNYSYGGNQSTGTNNGNSTVGEFSQGETSTSELSSIGSSTALESLLSILTTSPSTITSEERASYLKELLTLKTQETDPELSEQIAEMDPQVLQTYLNQIYNGELVINDATVSVTYDILERIAEEYNIELKQLLTSEDNMDTIRNKVESMSQEYIELFNSNDLNTELKNIYDGTNIENKDESFVSSVRTVIDLIAINKGTTGDALLLESSNADTIKTEIGKVAESLGQLRIMSTKSNSEFLTALNNIFTGDEVETTTTNGQTA